MRWRVTFDAQSEQARSRIDQREIDAEGITRGSHGLMAEPTKERSHILRQG